MQAKLLLTLCTASSSAFVLRQPSFAARTLPSLLSSSTLSRLTMSTLASDAVNDSKPFAVVVHTEIDPNRMAEFMQMIEKNAVETRKEPECVRFDVVRSQEAPNQFIFYELYKSSNGMEYHKQQKHYQAWADFKASGGTLSAVTYKNDGEFVTL